MKMKNLLFLFLLIFSFNSYGQEIIAPTMVCQGDCHEIFYEGPGNQSDLVWTVNYNGVNQTYLEPNLFLCFQQAGNVEIELWVNNLFYNHFITVGQAGEFNITTDPSCSELSPDTCTQVCAFSTVTYSIDNPSNQPVEWTINGAVDYEVNQNTVTVDWGEPGQGTVAVNTLDSLNGPLTITCGQSLYCNVTAVGFCGGYVNVSGGVGSYELFIITPNGIFESLGVFQQNSFEFDYPDPGTYTLRVVDANQNEQECSIELVEPPNPICAFSLIVLNDFITPSFSENACDGSIELFISGGIPPFTYTWSDGQTVQNLDQVCCGNYSVTITDSAGCSASRDYFVPCSPTINCSSSGEICVNILAEPVAAFSTEPAAVNEVVNICQGQTVFFQNESLNAKNFTWDFGPGQVFNDINANYTYNNPGTFVVSLIAANACFCADTTAVTVIVDPSIGPEIDCVGTICEGETITYTSSSDCTIFNWTVSPNGTVTEGGGTSDDFITIQWGDGPIGTINLAVDNLSLIHI